jgi:hypothetical protein
LSGGRWRSELAAGWPLLAAATIACGTGASSLVYYSFGLFVEPLQQHFHWSRGEVSSTLLFGSAGLVLAAPVLGWLIDRHGARRVAVRDPVPGHGAVRADLLRRSAGRFYARCADHDRRQRHHAHPLHARGRRRFDTARGLALGITLAGPARPPCCPPRKPYRGVRLAQRLLARPRWRSCRGRWSMVAEVPLSAAPAAGGESRHASARHCARARSDPGCRFRRHLHVCSAVVVHMVPMLRDAGIEPVRAAPAAVIESA